ncbi:hypothetical protein HII31_06135 [Pseudocercospora fuligena]|uniref:Meiotically up-regulated gene 154 protein n=1 Tax=Pseudocercospora fuligena TaxID=685502 RepID=A0A8H6RK81_9PEZI|nr:hypothetical protein HII31_06135 [Pseudocercospora fuligena]
MPRLVRRAPLSERIKAYLDPYDVLLWLSEYLNDDAYEEWLKLWAVPIALGLHIVFILAQGASKRGPAKRGDDVFGEDGSGGSGWFAWMAALVMHSITLLACLNALWTFFKKRSYRLFEQPVDMPPATPSASRVRVDSSPLSSSPLRYLQHVVSTTTAASRAYPDAEREVWELNIWAPNELNLTLFTLFSPGHVLIYYLLLPPAAMDPRPSVTVVTAVAFSALLSLQLWLMKSSFVQQAKDQALVHGEVMNEYDTKFVHPFLNRPVRDVGVQTRGTTTPRGSKIREVDVYTPTTIVKRAFSTNPNPNYAIQYDPQNLSASRPSSRRESGQIAALESFDTPPNAYANAQTQSYSRPSTGVASAADFSSPLKPHHERLRERSPVKGDGGSLGVYSHAASPLRKAVSTNQLRAGRENGRISSPLKRMSTPGSGFPSDQLSGGRRRETGRY